MIRKYKWLSIVVATFMLIATASPVFAQDGTDPLDEPAVVEETSSFLDNPIVKLLSNFFASLFEPDEPVDTTEGTGDGTEPPADPTSEPGAGEGDPEEGGGEAEPTPEPTLAPDEQVAAMHTEENLGFGEITKLLQIVAEAKIACTTEGLNCDVTLSSLMDEYKSGVGMGELYKTYGKPSITGVGQTKKELDTDSKEKSNNGKAKGKDK